MSIDTKHRVDTTELMDDLSIEGPELTRTLDQIEAINKRLGGHELIRTGLNKLLKNTSDKQPLRIADLGCGNGGTLRMLANYSQKHGLDIQFTGIDANPNTIEYAISLNEPYPEIKYKCLNILEPTLYKEQYDIILCTLTLHHFSEEELLTLVKAFYDQARIGVIINDLHRSKLAYHLFTIIAKLFRLTPMAREDGATSVLRGFKKKELINYSKKLNFKHYSIHWKWAFRYQWIIRK